MPKTVTIASLFVIIAFTSAIEWQSADKFAYEYYADPGAKKNFHDAKKFCQDLNSSLPQLPTKAEQDWIFTNVSKKNHFWLNALGVPSTTTYHGWADGSRFNYQNWAVNEPNDKAACEAIVVYNGQWHDTGCGNKYISTVCQKRKLTVQDEKVKRIEETLVGTRQELFSHVLSSRKALEIVEQRMDTAFKVTNDTMVAQKEEGARQVRNVSNYLQRKLEGELNATVQNLTGLLNEKVSSVEGDLNSLEINLNEEATKTNASLNAFLLDTESKLTLINGSVASLSGHFLDLVQLNNDSLNQLSADMSSFRAMFEEFKLNSEQKWTEFAKDISASKEERKELASSSVNKMNATLDGIQGKIMDNIQQASKASAAKFGHLSDEINYQTVHFTNMTWTLSELVKNLMTRAPDQVGVRQAKESSTIGVSMSVALVLIVLLIAIAASLAYALRYTKDQLDATNAKLLANDNYNLECA